jgi:hypothetical protein
VSDDLTETTVRYLFAATWLPCNTNENVVAVPGGVATALEQQLSDAVATDCIRTIADGYSPSLGDSL